MAYLRLLELHWNGLTPKHKKELMLEVAYSLNGGTNWNSLFVRLVGKSDIANLNRLFEVAPDLSAAAHAMYNGLISYEAWKNYQTEAAEAAKEATKYQYEVTAEVKARMSVDGHVIVDPHSFRIPEKELDDIYEDTPDDMDILLNAVDEHPYVNIRVGVLRRLLKEKNEVQG